jgi:hypothetical protein
VIHEALVGGKEAVVSSHTLASDPDENGNATLLDIQQVDQQRYFDAGGFAGRTVGLKSP